MFVCDATGVFGESCTGAVFHVPINNDQRSTVYVVEKPSSESPDQHKSLPP